MRILILPLVIVLFCSSQNSFSQGTCATAYSLNALTGNACAPSPFTTSTTNGTPQATCNGTNMSRRVTWFQFTVGATCPMFNFSNSGNLASEISLWSGTCGGTLTEQTGSRLCMANGSGLWSPSTTLAAGVYYLKVWTNTTTSTNITVCSYDITTATTVALNTPCVNVPVDAVTPASTAGNSLACSYSNTDADRTVTWIKFHPSSSTACVNFGISTNSTATTTKAEVNLFSGTCGSAILPAQSMCLEDGTGIWSPGPGFTWPNYSGTANYYLRVYTSGIFTPIGGAQKQITFCGTETAPVNDLCSGAMQIDGGLKQDNNACDHGGNTEPIYSGSTTNGNSSTPNAGWVCAGILHNTAWYKFKVGDPSTPSSVDFRAINCDLYSGTSGETGQPGGSIQIGLMTGSCSTGLLKAKSASNPSGDVNGAPNCYQGPGAGALHTASLIIPANSYPSGTWVYIGVDGYNGSNCKYGLSLTNAIPIPIKLTKFMVFNASSSNLVMWTTGSELNNAYFEIERSADGISFAPIGRVESEGNSTWDVHYKFEDANPLLLGYYRLKQVDIDGKSDYSDIVRIQRSIAESEFKIAFPNPVRNSATIGIMSPQKGTVTIQVVDVAGRNLSTQLVECYAGYNTISKDFSRLTPGNYYLIATQGDSRAVKSFIKQ